MILESSRDILPYLKRLTPSSDLVVDFEATGLDVLARDFVLVGIGIACEMFPDGIYCPIEYTPECDLMMLELSKHKLIAHNVSYDARGLEHYYRGIDGYVPMSKFPWKNDTQLMFKALANEGYPDQTWGLKDAQKSVLGWTETNEVRLDDWLIDNGYFKKKGKKGEKKIVPDKGKMSEAPHEILGEYCGLDAQSTWALYKHFETYYIPFPDMKDILESEMMVLAALEVEEFFRGMYVDENKLQDNMTAIERTMAALLHEVITDSEVTPGIEYFNQQKIQEFLDTEPPMLTKDGDFTSRYCNWIEKYPIASSTNHFNLNSKPQLCWLFYDWLYETGDMIKVHSPWKKTPTYHFFVTIDGIQHRVEGTPSGKRSVTKEILPKMGRAGKLLLRYNELIKLLSYMRGMIKSLVDNIHHTQLRLYGTNTGRCAGTGGVNIQQLQKVREYLDCLQPRPGFAFIQMDVDALEPVVLAELSEDAALMGLYGPGAKPNDVYLYVGASIPALRDEICAYGYDPLNPTSEAISITKKKAKRLRAICKTLHLAAGYGAGAPTIYKKLVQSGVVITLREVEKIREAYWVLFAGVLAYESKLKDYYAANGGWFINGRGMPVCVAAADEKDLLNQNIQSTGHYNLLTYIKNLKYVREECPELTLYPVVIDFHDETVWEVPIEQIQLALAVFRRTWDLTNEELGGIINLSGEPEVHYSFSDFKCEGGYRLAEINEEFNLGVV